MDFISTSLKALCIILPLTYTTAGNIISHPSSALPLDLASLQTTNDSFNLPPRAFRIRTAYTLRPLDPTATLMNTVQALVDIGIEDFNGDMQAESKSLPDYSNVRIFINSPPGAASNIKRKYVIWGLSSAMSFMARDKKFVASQWFLSWNNAPVGIIKFAAQDGTALNVEGGAQTNTTTNDTTTLTSRSIDTSNPNHTADRRAVGNGDSMLNGISNPDNLNLLINYSGIPLSLLSVFIPVIQFLSQTAEHDQSSIVTPSTFWAEQSDVSIRFGNDKIPARTTEPEFTYRYLTEAAGKIPGYMVREGKFESADLVIEVGGWWVGDGWIRQGRG